MDDETPSAEPKQTETASRRKSATISFLCDHDPGAGHAAVHFVGTDPDECAYFFEARSQHACLSAEPHQPGSVGPGGVFALILGIALVVYFAGGIFYQRTVEHARGWRQLPNHTLWQGMWESIKVRLFLTPEAGSGVEWLLTVTRTLPSWARRPA
ncbi:hypothetical protein IMZ48_12325 [Candidatus Bathyarchaeota archaeon]|nr:hypothetical protein [Candidatus Bathyarchaeota archaeon]